MTQAINDLARSLATTQNALEDNVWLSGAKIIHQTVQTKRRNQQLSEKNFMDWVGLRHNVEGLVAGALAYQHVNVCYLSYQGSF